MGRVEERTIPWDGGKESAIVKVRVWSMRERDIYDRKWGMGGEAYIGGVIGALNAAGVKGIHLARSLAEDQRNRISAQGAGSMLDKLATVVEEVTIPNDGTRSRLGAGNPEALDSWRAWLEGLDADNFDAIAKAVADVLALKDDEKKTSGSGQKAKP